jgi:hypothetical protein
MSSNTVKYGQLYNYLESLGYNAQVIEKHIVFRSPERELPVILPKASKTEEVRASHLAAVERILVLDGVVGGGQLPSSMSRRYSAFKSSISKASHVKAANAKALHVKPANANALHVKPANANASHSKAANAKASHVKALKARSSES